MKKIVITQSIEQMKDFVTLANGINAEVIVFPVIKVVPLPITHQLKHIFYNVQAYDWIIFTSINSVRYFFYVLMNQFLKLPGGKPQIACMGEKTVQTLKTYGKSPDFFLPDQSLSDFYRSFIKTNKVTESHQVLIPVSQQELSGMEDIRIASCQCRFLPIFETQMNTFIPAPQIAQVKNTEDLIITFFTPPAFENFIKIIPVKEFNKGWDLIAGGADTENLMLQHGVHHLYKAEQAKSDVVFEIVKNLLDTRAEKG